MSRADDINDDEHIDSPMVGDDEFIVDFGGIFDDRVSVVELLMHCITCMLQKNFIRY
jgi:hypothetical protein